MNINSLKMAAVTAALISSGGAHAALSTCNNSDVKYSPDYPDPGYVLINATDCEILQKGGADQNVNVDDVNTAWSAEYGAGLFEQAGTVDLFGGSFTFTISSNTFTATTGTYLITATDNNGAAAPNFPINIDFVVALKGGSAEAGIYLFDDAVFDGRGGGTWLVSFVNTGGQTPNLSNINLFVREGGGGVPANSNDVPEPGTLALLGGALFGLWAVRRRKEEA